MSRFPASAASAALAAALVGVALGARGGSALERTSIVELALVGAGTLAVCAALLVAPPGRTHGGWTVLSFAALTTIAALSVGWSIAPDSSYVAAGLALAYLAVFAGAVAAARMRPGAAPVVVRGLLLATVAVAAYGLASRVWPASFEESGFGGRIGQPFDYWNALGGVTAIGIVPALWLGARRTGSPLGRVLAFPAAGVLIATLLITQSRGALAAAAVACLLWLALVPLRLRSLLVLAAGAAAAAPAAAWAVSKDPFTRALEPLSAREAVATDFGLLLAGALVALIAVGIAIEAVRARHRPSVRTRVRIGSAVAVAAALIPLALATSVATSDRGLGGTLSDRYDELTSDTAAPPSGGARLGSVSSERAGYWREAIDALEERPLIGLGADSFGMSRLVHRNDGGRAQRAHGFVAQTLADTGLLGLAAALALLATWLAAAARATGIGPRRWVAKRSWDGERAAVVALALGVVAYGIQGAADWTWFVPGLTAMALVAAGFVAGRGPAAAAAPASPPRRPRTAPGAALAVAGVVITALLCGWAIWQPVVADRAVARSYDLLDRDRPAAALHEARQAHEDYPYSNDPLYAETAALVELDREAAALGALRGAALARPRDPEPWIRIADFELQVLDSPEGTLKVIGGALRRDPYSQLAATVRDRAAEVLAERERPPEPTTP